MLLVFGSILVIIFGLLVFLRPWVGVIALLLLQIPLSRLTPHVDPFEIGYIFCFLLVMFGWLSKQFMEQKNFRIASLSLSILCFCTYIVLALPQSIINNTGILSSLKQCMRFLNLLLFFPIVTEFRDKKRLQLLLTMFLAAGTITSLYAIFWNLKHGSGMTFGTMGRGIAGNPFPAVIYLPTTILLISLYGYCRNNWIRRFLLLALFLNLWRATLGFRRHPVGVLIFSTILILFFALLRKDYHTVFSYAKMIAIFTIFFTMLSLLSAYVNLHHYKERFSWNASTTGMESGVKIRTMAMSEALDGYLNYDLQNLILGKGLGLEETHFDIWKNQYEDMVVHNLYIFILIRSGFIGLAMYLWMLFKGIQVGVSLIPNMEDAYWTAISVGFAAGLLAMALLSITSCKGTRTDFFLFLSIAFGFIHILNADLITQETV